LSEERCDYGVTGKHGKGEEKRKGVSNYHPKFHTVMCIYLIIIIGKQTSKAMFYGFLTFWWTFKL